MLYKDVQKIEFDQDRYILYIYGPYSGKVTESRYNDYCITSYGAYDDSDLDCHFTLCSYYNNFEQLLGDLSERVGMPILYV